MKSSEFLPELIKLKNFRDIEISDIKVDSREVNEGDIFFAIKGHNLDGNDFIPLAFERGASLVVTDSVNKYASCIVDFLTGKISACRLVTDKKERITNIDVFLIEMINNDFCEYIYDF